MERQRRVNQVGYILPERRFTGTDTEILRELDELIESLVAFRASLASPRARTRVGSLPRPPARRAPAVW